MKNEAKVANYEERRREYLQNMADKLQKKQQKREEMYNQERPVHYRKEW